MTKFLTLWKIETNRIPDSAKDRIKIDTMLLNMVKDDLKHGNTLEWGMFAGGSQAGYSICGGGCIAHRNYLFYIILLYKITHSFV